MNLARGNKLYSCKIQDQYQKTKNSDNFNCERKKTCEIKSVFTNTRNDQICLNFEFDTNYAQNDLLI